ncbi:MAG: hypothetical protein KF734_16215 [Saprospiraceae bacterium]|nr:hypothetical protein [Saprospiraceae bacterium]
MNTLNLLPSTFYPQPSTLYPQPSTFNLLPSTLNLQPSTLYLLPSTLHLRFYKERIILAQGLPRYANQFGVKGSANPFEYV